jgi:hypothetical protein
MMATYVWQLILFKKLPKKVFFDIFWHFFQKTATEEKIPLAFSILCHGNLGILEALFASVFRPQNAYCIYVDDKAPTTYKKAVRQMAGIYQYHFPEVSYYTTVTVCQVPKRTALVPKSSSA